MMPRVVMAAAIAGPCLRVHGFPLDAGGVRSILSVMSRETVNLICAELPGTERVAGPEGEDLWTLAHEPFAQVTDHVEVRVGEGWTPLPPLSDHDLRERIVEAYEAVRHALPGDVQVTLDRTSG